MAKSSGLGDNLYVSGYNLSGDVGSLSSIAGGNSPLVVTGIDKSAIERIGGQRDGAISFSTFWNTTGEHPVLSTLPTADRIVSYFRGAVLGNPAASCMAKQINYDWSRGGDGALEGSINAQANAFGLEWGIDMTGGVRTDSTATTGAGHDFGAATTFGMQAYLHVFAFTGTSVTITIEQDDNGSFTTPTTIGTFTAATGITSERIAVAGSIEQHLRVVSAGTFSDAQFAVVVVHNATEVVF